MQRTLNKNKKLHVAMIMDGNGRWAAARSKPRAVGHYAGAEAARHIIEVAPELNISTLTLYAFSGDNWHRPDREVSALMKLFRKYLALETGRCIDNGVKLDFIGRRDRVAKEVRFAMEHTETATANGQRLHLRIAIDYSARDSILQAARRLNGAPNVSRELFAQLLSSTPQAPSPNVDLLIRTGGEQRLSDFLLWECAYAELYFVNHFWPDFKPADLKAAIEWFHQRERRFGRLPDNHESLTCTE